MLDRNKTYSVKRHPGVAFYFVGYPQIWEPYTFMGTDSEGNEFEGTSGEGEWIDDTSAVLMVMVGDDYKWRVDERDCTELHEEEYCRGCGQIGCTAEGSAS